MENVQHALSHGPRECVRRVQFGLLDADTIERLSVCEVKEAVIYSRGAPAPNGCMDPRLGSIDRRLHCATCGNDVRTCCGHIGRIDLPVACFNVGYLEHTRKILQTVCIACQRLCWDPADERVQAVINGRTTGRHRLGAVYKLCRPRTTCARCAAPRGIVQRVALTYRIEYAPTALLELDDAEAAFYTQPLHAEVVRSVFQFIPPDEQRQLGFRIEHARPVDMIVTRLVVPPAIIRPAISASEGSRARGQDDLTVKLQEINKRCIEIRNHMRAHHWDRHSIPPEALDRIARLQFDVATLVANIRGMRPSTMRSGIPLKSVTDRLKGKEGRFRANLMGKRVDQSARSVISPDPTLDLDEVGVPPAIALTLTISDRVTVHNLQKMRARVAVGAGQLAGAEALTLRDGKCVQLAYVRSLAALEVVPGCIVERYLQDGDRVIFNRQPTLHKMGMMAHRVRVMPGDTFRLNLSCTTPYNADFDGDEMNLHVPQSLAAISEAREIMGVAKQIVAPQANKPCIGLVQDTLLGTYLMTAPDVFIDRAGVMQLLMQLKHPAEKDLLKMIPRPAILRPRELWTGSQIFSLLLPRGLSMGAPLKQLGTLGSEAARIDDGRLVHGRLSKQHVGTSAGGVVHLLYLDFDDETAARFLSEAQRLVNHWLMAQGFSIGIRDCMRPEAARLQVAEYVELASRHVDAITEAAAAAGSAASASEVEDAIQDVLTRVLGAAGGIVAQHVAGSCLDATIRAGSKGNPINIAQIAGCVGQQCVEGRRIDPPAPATRSLPCFDHSDMSGASRGFVRSPYVDGLTPDEYFFHAMGGREGLVDTAVKTARTGYIQRRLVKGMESLSVASDGSVRNASNGVVEFVYGSDGFDATWIERQPCAALDLADAELALRCPGAAELAWVVDVRSRVRAAMLKGSVGTLVPHVFVPVPAARLLEQCRAGRRYDADDDDLGLPADLLPSQFARATWLECRALCCAGGVGCAGLELLLAYEWRAEAVSGLSPAARAWLRREAVRRTARARISQGEMVGCIAAQSIGEPTTQMTLNTFHLAGVGSKNVTQGVPRIQELIDVTRKIKKPLATVHLVNPTPERCAEFIRSLPGIRLTEVVRARRVESLEAADADATEARRLYGLAFPEVQRADDESAGAVVLVLDLDMRRMREHALVPADVKRALDRLYNAERRLLEVVTSDACARRWSVHLRLLGDVRDMAQRLPAEQSAGFHVHLLQRVGDFVVDATPIGGVKGVSEATSREVTRRVVGPDGAAVDRRELVVDAAGVVAAGSTPGERPGAALAKLLALEGVDATRTVSNDVTEVHAVLGIEAAATTLACELSETLGYDGRYINVRHVTTVVNTMTCRGFLMQLSRHGINRVETGPLVRCSFEETVDTLFDAAAFGEYDDVQGVTVSLMLGQLCPIGTGTMDVVDAADRTPERRVVHSRYRVRAAVSKEARPRVVHSRMAYQHRCDDGHRVPTLAMCRPAELGGPARKRARAADELVFGAAGALDLPFIQQPGADDDVDGGSAASGTPAAGPHGPHESAGAGVDSRPEFVLGRVGIAAWLAGLRATQG